MSFCLPGRWQICPTSRPFLAAHAMFAPVVGGFNKSDWRLAAQPFKYTLNWKICFTLEDQLKTKPFSSRKLQRVGTRWTTLKPDDSNLLHWPRNLYQVSDHAAEVHGPMESSPHHFLDVNLGSWQTGNLLVSKMQPIKNLQIPTSKFMTGLEWLKFPKFLSLLASQHDFVTA